VGAIRLADAETHAPKDQNQVLGKTPHKYGIRIPKNVKEAIEIDKENGNTLWMDAIKLEMRNVRIAFEEFDGDPNT
jgi:hypothetical protein